MMMDTDSATADDATVGDARLLWQSMSPSVVAVVIND